MSDWRIPRLPREEWTDAAREVFSFWGEPHAWEEGSKTNIMMVMAKTSRLVERAVPAGQMMRAAPPSGDFAFATAVAAFGQILRGDPLMQGYTLAKAAALAGTPRDFWRQEFVKLASVADGLKRPDEPVRPLRD